MFIVKYMDQSFKIINKVEKCRLSILKRKSIAFIKVDICLQRGNLSNYMLI